MSKRYDRITFPLQELEQAILNDRLSNYVRGALRVKLQQPINTDSFGQVSATALIKEEARLIAVAHEVRRQLVNLLLYADRPWDGRKPLVCNVGFTFSDNDITIEAASLTIMAEEGKPT